MSLIDQMRSDTTWFLTQWGESLLRYRAACSYDAAGVGIERWSSSLSFTGDFQVVSGKEIEAEAGLEHHSEYEIMAEYDVDVLAHDRVLRDGVNYRVNYTRVFEDQTVVYVYREIDQ